MVRFEKDQLSIVIPSISPVEAYVDTMNALQKLFYIAAQTSGENDEEVLKAIEVLSYYLGQNMSQLEPQMMLHMARGIAPNIQADEAAQDAA